MLSIEEQALQMPSNNKSSVGHKSSSEGEFMFIKNFLSFIFNAIFTFVKLRF